MAGTPDLREFAARLHAWAAQTFPYRTSGGAAQHLADEAQELQMALLAGSPDLVAEEAADCFILLLRIAELEGFDLLAAAEAKFAEVQTRRWGEPDARGVVRHIDEARNRRGR